MRVIIAEKPDVAKHWAKIVGAKTFNDGYIEGNGYQVTWAYGHLVSQAEPAAYVFSTGRRKTCRCFQIRLS